MLSAEERLAQINAGDRRRQARRRQTLREKGMTMQTVWLPAPMREQIDQGIETGRFKSRDDAINWALRTAFAENHA